MTLGTVSVAAILAESAARCPSDVAVTVGEDQTTYAEPWAQALAYAGGLRALGVREGDRVAMLIANVADFPRFTTPCWLSVRSSCQCTRS